MNVNFFFRNNNMKEIEELKMLYLNIKKDIVKRLEEFDLLCKKNDEYSIFKEFVFCLLTPQSKAKVCWASVKEMELKNVLEKGSKKDILECIKKVRFKNKKAEYILIAREKFYINGKFILIKKLRDFKNIFSFRDYLVKEVKGMGYKEASHFLRNIGRGKDLAILDRHILKNLKRYGVIEDIPENLSRRLYLEIESRMIDFSKNIEIELAHLDLLLWYKETGEIFK